MKKSTLIKFIVITICIDLLGCKTLKSTTESTQVSQMNWSTPDIPTLKTLSIENLRSRSYGSEFKNLRQVDNHSNGYKSYMTSYQSDGLTLYARIDIPTAEPMNSGYPVMLYTHGWVGIEKAPQFNFFLNQKGSQAKYIDAFAKQGYIVITPGWRGHGSVDGVPAQGIEFMQEWDNASYLSPIFYSIDMLNALDSLDSLNQFLGNADVSFDKENVFLAAHSQGGDSALLTLAIAGEGSSVKNNITASSIFAGCFLPRLEQGKLYGAMAMTSQSFMSGDGSWTASAISATGIKNADFQFHFPPDWIATTNPSDWTWQNDVWKFDTVEQVFKHKYDEMYKVLRKNQLTNKDYTIVKDENNRSEVIHSNNIVNAYFENSAINYPQYITEPLTLHYSDRDYYSPPHWNELLASKLKVKGSKVKLNEYKGNTHSLTLSKHQWFSENYKVIGVDEMIKRDISWFKQL
jgi:dienelactone hydrolase